MKRAKRAATLLLCGLLAWTLLLTAACGASMNEDSASADQSYPSAAENGNFSTNAMPSEAEGDFGWAMDAPSAPESAPSAGQTSQLPSGVKMIYRGYLELESTQFDQTAAGLEQLAAGMGGYFESSQLYNYGSRRSANYTVRVPSGKYQEFCAQVGGLAQINSQSHTTEDVSRDYYDTQSRLETQRTKLARLQELLAKAEDMADLITIESAIADTEWSIESLTTTLRDYDALVDFSTVEISLEEVVTLSPQEALQETFGARLARAFRQGAQRFGELLQDLALSLAYGWVGWLLVLAVIVVILVVWRRRRAKKRGTPAASSEQPPRQDPQDKPKN